MHQILAQNMWPENVCCISCFFARYMICPLQILLALKWMKIWNSRTWWTRCQNLHKSWSFPTRLKTLDAFLVAQRLGPTWRDGFGNWHGGSCFFSSFVVLVADGMRPVDHSALHCHWSGFPFAAWDWPFARQVRQTFSRLNAPRGAWLVERV